MKKLQYILLVLAFALASCNHKDSIWNVMGDMDSRVSTLEVLCQEMNTNISSLETIIKAQNNGDYITNVTEIRNGNTIVGYTITFNHHDPITIYNGTNGKDGRDGVDGYKPAVGAKQDADGIYYWTVDGDWLTDANGNKIRVTGEKGDKGEKGDTGDKGQDGHDGTNGVNGNTPQLKIDGGYWYISYDGTNWTQLGKATGEKGDKGDSGESIFKSVTQDDDHIYFTLADNTVIKISKNGNGSSTGDQPNSEFLFEVTYDANGGIGTMPKDTFYYGISQELANSSFEKEGYYFSGWNTDPNGSGAFYKNRQSLVINKSIILYAQWKKCRTMIGKFSVDDTKQVEFSCGNLQYDEYSSRWLFAEHQYGLLSKPGCDLFGWGTGNNPTNLSGNLEDYQTFVDWGNNVICGYHPNTWRTMTADEWYYLIYSRPDAEKLFTHAKVNGVCGLIILPDNWVTPVLITLVLSTEKNMTWNYSGDVYSYDYSGSDYRNFYEYNVYNTTQWQILEDAGAVFFPAAGYYYANNLNNYTNQGFYWLSTGGRYNNNSMDFHSTGLNLRQDTRRPNGYSVRLVRDL